MWTVSPFELHLKEMVMRFLLAVALAVTPFGTASAQQQPVTGGAGQTPPVAIEMAGVKQEAALEVAQAVGSLRAAQTTMLRPETAGRITSLNVSDGQRVKKGQLLVQLDDAVQQAQLAQALAQAATSDSNVRRQQELLLKGFVSASAVEQAQTAAQVAHAQVQLARAELGRMQVRAPFSGVAGIRLVSLGDYVKDGADLISLEDPSKLWADFRLAEQFAGRLRLGQPVTVSVDALPATRLQGVVQAVDAQVDAEGRALLVRATLKNTVPNLRSGLFIRVTLELGRREAALWVPEEALLPLAGKLYVFKVKDGEARRASVKIGARKPGWVEILEGVTAGEMVVTAGQQRLRGESNKVKSVDPDTLGAGVKKGN
jgi:membrane fusion protein, multidrug efflux system